MSKRIEVWTSPLVSGGTFEPKAYPTGNAAASFTKRVSAIGDGSLTVDPDYEYLDQLVLKDLENPANDVESLVRIFDEAATLPLYEYFIRRRSAQTNEAGQINLSGEGIEHIFAECDAECWDWDGSAQFTTRFPNWIYGGENQLDNGGGEDSAGTREAWQLYIPPETWGLDLTSATGGTFTLSYDGDTTDPIDWDATKGTIASDLEDLAGINEVTVEQEDDGTAFFNIRFDDPIDLSAGPLTINTGSLTGSASVTKFTDGPTGATPTFTITVDGDTTGPIDYDTSVVNLESELQGLSTVTDVLVTGEGTYDDPWEITFYVPQQLTSGVTVDDTGLGDGEDRLEQIATGDPEPSPWTQSQLADARQDPFLHGTYGEPGVAISDTQVRTGNYSFVVDGQSQFAGLQQIIEVTPGGTYQASLWVYTPNDFDPFRLVIRDQYENLLAASKPFGGITVPANTWTEVTIDDVNIPEGVNTIIFRFAYVGTGNPATFYVDDARFDEGMPPATVGQIMRELIEDAQTDHAPDRELLTMIDISSFTDDVDSSGASWVEDLSLTINHGAPYSDILATFTQLGYKWKLVPTGPATGVWSLEIYNPTSDVGVDYSGDDEIAIVLGDSGITAAPIDQATPKGNRVIYQGEQGFTYRTEDTDSIGAIGTKEVFVANEDLGPDATVSAADQHLVDLLEDGYSVSVQYTDPDLALVQPLIDYDAGDVVDFMTVDNRLSVAVAAVTCALSPQSETITVSLNRESYAGMVQANASGGSGGVSVSGSTSDGSGLRDLSIEDLIGQVSGFAGRPSSPFDANIMATMEGTRRLLEAFKRPPVPVGAANSIVPSRGGGELVVVVAAADASETSKRKADFQCDGTNDHVEINSAIDLMVDGYGGEVVLTEGSFYISVGEITLPTGVSLVGQGMYSTYLFSPNQGCDPVAGDFITLSTGSMIRDMWVECSESNNQNDIACGNETAMVLQNLLMVGSGDHAIYLDSPGNSVLRNIILNSSSTTAEVFISSGGYMDIDIQAESCSATVLDCDALFDSRINVIAANCDEGALFLGLNSYRVYGHVTASACGSPSEPAVDIDSAFGIIDLHVTVSTSDGHGVRINDSDEVQLSGSVEGSGLNADDTYDNVIVSGDSDRVRIEQLVSRPSAAGNQPRYGINLSASTVDEAIVVGNDLGTNSSYGSGAYNDSGTGTINSYPGDATYGDNFVA